MNSTQHKPGLKTLPQACLFDLDGLLLNTEPLHGQAWEAAAAHFGTQLRQAQLLALRGRRRRDCADQVVRWLDASIGSDELLAIQQPIARRLLPTAKPNAGAQQLVSWCAQHTMPMALVTSSAQESVAYKTAGHPWINQITTRVLGDDPNLEAGKPAPDPFLLAAQRLNVEASSCWAFEDSAAGTHAALAAGCHVWVLNPDGNNLDCGILPKDGAWQTIASLNDVLTALKTQ